MDKLEAFLQMMDYFFESMFWTLYDVLNYFVDWICRMAMNIYKFMMRPVVIHIIKKCSRKIINESFEMIEMLEDNDVLKQEWKQTFNHISRQFFWTVGYWHVFELSKEIDNKYADLIDYVYWGVLPACA